MTSEPLDPGRIARDLESADDEVRRLAVERAGLLAPADAVPLLVGRLGDESWRVRKAAIDRLVATPEPARAAASLLCALADGENPGRRNAALEALIRCGSSAVPTLLEATRSPDVDVRKQVVDALAGVGDPSALARLVELLRDEDANVRGAAADALGAIGRRDASGALLERVASDPERLVRLSALRALDCLEEPVAAVALESVLADATLRAAALSLLGHSEDPMAREVLLKGLGSGSRAARDAAMRGLLRGLARLSHDEAERLLERTRGVVEADPALMEALRERLSGGDLASRLEAVQFVGALGIPRAIPALHRAGRDEALREVVVAMLSRTARALEEGLEGSFESLEADERALACEALAHGDGTPGERQLRDALCDGDALVRAAAVQALVARGGEDALERLIERFERATGEDDGEGDEVVLLGEAIEALAASGSAGRDGGRAASLVADRIHEGSEGYRCAAAHVLASLGGSAAADPLALLLSDPSERVRRAAVEALARLPGTTLAEGLHLALADDAPTVRIAAAAALAASDDPRALDDLDQLAHDEDPLVRAAAMRAVGAMAGRAHGERFERGLALLERGAAADGPVAMAALESLRELADPRAVGMAARLLEASAPELVCAAIACVGRAAELPRLEMLIPLIDHEHWSVRAEVARVLGERGARRAAPAVRQRLEREEDDFVRGTLGEALERLEVDAT